MYRLDSIKIFSTTIQKFYPLYDMCTRVYIYIYLCVYVCMCIYIHIYIYILVWKSFQFRPLNRSFSFSDSLHKHPSLRVFNRKNSYCNSKKDRDVLLPPANILSSLKNTGFRGILFYFFFLFMVEEYTSNRNRDFFALCQYSIVVEEHGSVRFFSW